MRRYLILALAALILAVTAPSAFATIKIIVHDPGINPCNSSPDCIITSPGVDYAVPFTACTALPASQQPTAPYTGCLWLNYVSSSAVGELRIDLDVAPADGGQTLDCAGTTGGNNCSDTATPTGGGAMSVSFYYDPPFSTTTGQDLYILTTFADWDSMGTAGVTFYGVPEPSELGLFGLGLLAIAVGFGLQRRRQKPRTNDAA